MLTLATKITITRILLIPVFVMCALYYGKSLREGSPDPGWRWAAVAVFTVAAVSDFFDGYYARKYGEQSRLGQLLDPIADKSLILSALITLSAVNWPGGFPLWFPVIVIARDIITVAGTFIVNHLAGHVEVVPHWSGKAATVATITAIGWVLLGGLALTGIPTVVPAIVAAALVVGSGALYSYQGFRQVEDSEQSKNSE